MQNLVVLDFGSQYTQLIARRVREIGIHSVLMPADVSLEEIDAKAPSAIVLSGGPRSVTDTSALRLPERFFEHCHEFGIPVLGICYGLQVIVTALNGKVEKVEAGGEYGRTEISIDTTSTLYKGTTKFEFLLLRSLFRGADVDSDGVDVTR